MFEPPTKLNYQFQKWDDRNHVFEAVNEKTYSIVIPKKSEVHFGNIKNPKPHSTFSLSKPNPKPKPSPKPKPNPNPQSTNTPFRITNMPPILDQGNLGDCVANAFSLCISLQTANNLSISRLYHYANCRILDNTSLDHDDGTTIQTACSAFSDYGACQETVWPYNISNALQMPPLSAYQAAKKFKSFTYTYIKQDLNSLKACLLTYKTPIIFGFLVYSSFMTQQVASTGQVPSPNVNTESNLGGHCISIVGFDDTTQKFTCANSWGTKWGANGYCFIPYTYLLNPNLASDFCFTQFQY